MSSAICFNLDQSKILLSGNGLNYELYKHVILQLWIHNYEMAHGMMMGYVFVTIETFAEEGENDN